MGEAQHKSRQKCPCVSLVFPTPRVRTASCKARWRSCSSGLPEGTCHAEAEQNRKGRVPRLQAWVLAPATASSCSSGCGITASNSKAILSCCQRRRLVPAPAPAELTGSRGLAVACRCAIEVHGPARACAAGAAGPAPPRPWGAGSSPAPSSCHGEQGATG